MQQEINEMLGGKMSNEDEDEVEDELEAMARESQAVPAVPDAPTQEPMPNVPASDPQRAKARAHERARRREGQEPIAA